MNPIQESQNFQTKFFGLYVDSNNLKEYQKDFVCLIYPAYHQLSARFPKFLDHQKELPFY